MTKSKDINQKIGEIGEAAFRLHALVNLNLTPNKIESDYGIDFTCQTNGEKTGDKWPMNAEYLLVNVKSSNKLKPSATLLKSDMEFTLIAKQAIVFILVDLQTNTIYHRFFDEELLKVFHERLLSNKVTFQLKPSIMSENVFQFNRDMELVNRRAYQNKLAYLKIRLGLEKLIGKVKLEVQTTEDGSIAFIEVEEVESMFDKTHKMFPLVRESFLAHNMKNGIDIPHGTLKKLDFNKINDIADKTSIIAPVYFEVSKEELIRSGKVIATCIFEYRRFGDETAIYHPSGISLALSARRKGLDNKYYHHTDVICTDYLTSSIFDHPDIIHFLGNLRSGDYLRNNYGNALPVNHWSDLIYLAEIIHTSMTSWVSNHTSS